MSSGKYLPAIKRLLKYIEIHPESGLIYYLLGQSHLQLKDYEKSKNYFEKAIEIQPKNPQANFGLATVYIRLKQPDKARQYMDVHKKWRQSRADSRKAYAGSDKVGVLSDSTDNEFAFFPQYLTKLCLHGSSLYRSEQNLEESEKLLRKEEKVLKRVIAIVPNQPDMYRELSVLYLVAGGYPDKAIELAEKAVELKGSAENYYTLFGAYSRKPDTVKALRALEKAIELDPGNLQYRQVYDKLTKGKR
jgi:tetratricopeptide (TPR) repeat protein